MDAAELRGRITSPVNRLLQERGYELRRKPRALVRSGHELRMTVEFVIAHLAARMTEPLTIVQVGAFDGAANDPIADALHRFNCRAMLVEPQPEPFQRLNAIYDSMGHVTTANVAIDGRDGTRDFYTVEPEGMPEWVAQLASFDRATIESHQRFLAPEQQIRVQATPVQTMTFETLLTEVGFERVDVLQIDAEGYDLELLRMFDVPTRLPAVVNWEHTHLSLTDRDAAVDLMIGCNYRVAMSDQDTVAYRP